MYIIYDDKNNIIGCHDELKIVEEYANNLEYYHPDIELHIRHMKDKKAAKIFGDKLTEYELQAFKGTYTPYKYIDYADFASRDTKNLQYCKDQLIALYKDPSLSKRECKNIKKVIFLLDDIIQDSDNYTSSPEELNKIERYFDEMSDMYSYSMYEKEIL